MDKTGVLTFSRSLNYGSTLQAWALTKTLKDLGAEPEILDYEPRGYRDIYATFRLPTGKRWLVYDALHLILLPFFVRRKRDFQRFWDRHYPKTDRVFRSPETLQEQERRYETLICGSDQIWNCRARDFDEQYMFPGLEGIRKVSYAVSINSGEVGDSAGKHRAWLNDFAHLSVREPNSREQLKKLLGEDREVSVCLDPTLLLQAEDFRPLMAPRAQEEPYIFFYSVRMRENALQAAEKVAAATGLRALTLISGTGSPYYLKHRRVIGLPRGSVGPDMFLSLAAHASCVVTDSFHGTAFSVIFHKPFCSIARKGKDGKPVDDVRMKNLLKLVGLEDRWVMPEEAAAVMDREIDWDRVDRLRMAEAERSRAYLRKALYWGMEETDVGEVCR